MSNLIEWIINFFTVWPGSAGSGSTESRKVTVGCLLVALILFGVVLYFAVL